MASTCYPSSRKGLWAGFTVGTAWSWEAGHCLLPFLQLSSVLWPLLSLAQGLHLPTCLPDGMPASTRPRCLFPAAFPLPEAGEDLAGPSGGRTLGRGQGSGKCGRGHCTGSRRQVSSNLQGRCALRAEGEPNSTGRKTKTGRLAIQ